MDFPSRVLSYCSRVGSWANEFETGGTWGTWKRWR